MLSGTLTERSEATGRSAAREYARAAARLQELEAELARSNRERDALRETLTQVEASTIWQAVGTLRRLLYGRIGAESRPARTLRTLLHAAVRRAAEERPPQPAPEPDRQPLARLPHFADPEVSLILPVHSQPDLTTACVRAIVATATVPYELIVVDDTATAPMKDVVERIEGAVVTVNRENLGYTRSLNRGAELARGEFVVFLNDDTEPRPGWLEAMVDCARDATDIGVVVPMYLEPDGRLKEAGSIVWRDGSAANFGRGDPFPERSRYRYRREVDYGSGACMLVRTELLREIGGLDEQFSPAYYEDVDLCFAAREAGSRVVYEPRARVVHVEGATAGTDLSAGDKRFQAINREPFVEKWRHRLAEQPTRGGDPRRASGRWSGPHVLVADASVPTPDRDGGSSRIWQLIRAFRGLGCAVTMLPAAGLAGEPYASRLEDEGVEVLRQPNEMEPELAAISPSLGLAVLSRPHVASRFLYMLRELAPAARIAYDVVDLHYLRELRRSVVEERPAGRSIDALRELELAMVRSSDVTVVVTEQERVAVLASVPDADVMVLPTIQSPLTDVPPLERRSGLILVGGFHHSPNADAASFLVRCVMPHVWRRQPDVRVTIVGQDPPAEVRGLAGPLVDVAGWVEELAPLLAAARVAVVPVRYGAGLRLKTIDAMARGLPVVSTGLGAEGLEAVDGVHLLLADEPDGIADRICDLLADDELWQRLSDGGRDLVRERFAPDVMTPRVRALLDQPSR